MLDWIDSFVYRWVNVVDTPIRDALKWTVHALAGVVYTVFGNVGRAWAGITGTADGLIHEATHFATVVYGWIRQIVLTDIPWLWHVLQSDVQWLINHVAAIYSDVLARILAAVRYAETLVQSAINWIIVHVYDPLKAEAERLYNDLLKWGYWSYQLLNDPGKLAGILLDWLIAAAEAAFWRIAPAAGRFILGVLIHQAPKLVTLLEDIFTAVL